MPGKVKWIVPAIAVFLFPMCDMFSFLYPDYNKRIRQLNRSLEAVAAELGVDWLDTHAAFITEGGKIRQDVFQDDGLHLSLTGYKVWAGEALRPHIMENGHALVAMVGNSLTAQALQKDGAGAVNSDWGDLLGIPAMNFGVEGDYSGDLLARVEDTFHDNVDCYYIMIGINDIQNAQPNWRIAGNVHDILKKYRAAGKTVALQSIFPVDMK